MRTISLMLILLASVPQEDGVTVTGVVKLKGDPPKSKNIKIACPPCAKLYPQGMSREDLVVNSEGAIQGAFVYIKTGLEGKKYAVPETPAVVEMKGCRYEPHVVGLRAGQKLRFRNQDPHNHCVHALAFVCKEMNVALIPGGEFEKTLEKPEVMIRLKDDVYPWMSGWIGLVDHPFFSVTGPDGKFELKGLPPGKYTVEVWQEKCAPTTQNLEVGNKGSTVEFALELKKE